MEHISTKDREKKERQMKGKAHETDAFMEPKDIKDK